MKSLKMITVFDLEPLINSFGFSRFKILLISGAKTNKFLLRMENGILIHEMQYTLYIMEQCQFNNKSKTVTIKRYLTVPLNKLPFLLYWA